MPWFDVQTLCNSHDQRPEQIHGNDMALFRFVRKRLDDLTFNETEDNQRIGLFRLRNESADLGNRAGISEDTQSPTIPKLNHRSSNRCTSRISRAVGNHEDRHLACFRRHAWSLAGLRRDGLGNHAIVGIH